MVDLARDGMVDLDVPDGGIDFELWVEAYLADVDHKLPVGAGARRHRRRHDGIISTGCGGWTYKGMFAVFNEHNDTSTGAPHRLASLRMTAAEWDDEQRLQLAFATANHDATG